MTGRVLAGSTLVFDLDGTLVDSASDIVASVNIALRKNGIRELSMREARPLIGRGARGILEVALKKESANHPAQILHTIFGDFLTHYTAHPVVESAPFEAAREVLWALNLLDARLVVCTNKPTAMAQLVLTKLGLAQFFGAVLGADMASLQKPSPAHVVEAIRAVGGNVERAVMIGDSSPDALAARAAGVPVILMTHGYADTDLATIESDLQLDHFHQLIAGCTQLLTRSR